jgi:hypothetical protein
MRRLGQPLSSIEVTGDFSCFLERPRRAPGGGEKNRAVLFCGPGRPGPGQAENRAGGSRDTGKRLLVMGAWPGFDAILISFSWSMTSRAPPLSQAQTIHDH